MSSFCEESLQEGRSEGRPLLMVQQTKLGQAVLLLAAAAVACRGHMSCDDLMGVLASLPCAFLLAAAALHSPASTAPLSARLASCQLLTSLMPSQDRADAVLGNVTGVCC